MRRLAPLLWLVPGLAAAIWACDSSSNRTKPAEVPIAEFEPGRPGSNDPRGGGDGVPVAAEEVDAGAVADKNADAGPTLSVAADPSAIAGKLDDKNGFAGATLGSATKSLRGVRSLDKKGADPARYRGPATYSGVALSVDYTFIGGKLALIAFNVKKSGDCKKIRDALDRELGVPQKATTNPESVVWKGNKVGLKYVAGVTCGGQVVSKDLDATDFTALDQ